LIEWLLNFASALDYASLLPDMYRTWKWHTSLHGSALHEFLHIIASSLFTIYALIVGAWIAAFLEGCCAGYKSIKLILLLKRGWHLTGDSKE
jgi:hypothetical protein